MRIDAKWRGMLIGGAAMSALALAPPVKSADHRDAPATTMDPPSDINDVYAFTDAGKVALVMTVFPFADATAKFSSATQYVFHTSSGAAFGTTTADQNVICTFDAAQKISCWAGDEYVTGDASVAGGITSKSGKLQVWAGPRSDPFFFNLDGFKDTVTAVKKAAGSLTFDGSGCPALDSDTVTALGGLLKETKSDADPTKMGADDFATAKTLGISILLDRTIVTKGGPIMSVWASTNKAK